MSFKGLFLTFRLNLFVSKVVIKTQQHPTTVTDKVRNRLEQLDDFEEVLCSVNDVTKWFCTWQNSAPFFSWSWLHNQLAQWNYWLLVCTLGRLWAELLNILGKIHPTSLGLDDANHFYRGTTVSTLGRGTELLIICLEKLCPTFLVLTTQLIGCFLYSTILFYWAVSLHCYSHMYVSLHQCLQLYIVCLLNIHWSGVLLVVIWMLSPDTAAILVHVLCMFLFIHFLEKKNLVKASNENNVLMYFCLAEDRTQWLDPSCACMVKATTRTTTFSPGSELVHQNSAPVKPSAWKQNICCRLAHYMTPSGIS